MSRWSCITCSKSFGRKGDLTRHALLHTGIRPHVCETCGKGFAQFSGLKTHWNVHTKAKPYVCGIGTCKKAFGDPSSRTRHRKETHRREGAYVCVITDCGTRIKRRSAFVAHLRKHGLDPNSLDLDAIVLESSEGRIPASTHFASPDVEHKNLHAELRSVSPYFPGHSTGHYNPKDGSETSRVTENNGWIDDGPFDCRWAALHPAGDGLLLGPTLDQFADPLGFPHDLFSYLSYNSETSSHFQGTLQTADNPLFDISPFNLSIPDPFPEAGSDGSQSSMSSPSSKHSALLIGDFNDDMVSLSLAGNAPESFLYSIM